MNLLIPTFIKCYLACRSFACLTRDHIQMFMVVRFILGIVNIPLSITFLSLLLIRRKARQNMVDNNVTTTSSIHSGTIKVAVIAIISDIVLGFLPCVAHVLLNLYHSTATILTGPFVGFAYNLEHIVMIASYMYVFRKKVKKNRITKITVTA